MCVELINSVSLTHNLSKILTFLFCCRYRAKNRKPSGRGGLSKGDGSKDKSLERTYMSPDDCRFPPPSRDGKSFSDSVLLFV